MENLLKWRWWIGAGLLLVVVVIMLLQKPPSTVPVAFEPVEDVATNLDGEEAVAAVHVDGVETEQFVDVKGFVKNPGVYEINAAMRVKDVIELAGGFTENAAVDHVNLAKKMTDGEMIYIPSISEQAEIEKGVQPEEEVRKISINLASVDELQQLPNIGPKKAEAIVTYREEHGVFATVEDLKNVSGIGEKTFEQLAPHIEL